MDLVKKLANISAYILAYCFIISLNELDPPINVDALRTHLTKAYEDFSTEFPCLLIAAFLLRLVEWCLILRNGRKRVSTGKIDIFLRKYHDDICMCCVGEQCDFLQDLSTRFVTDSSPNG